MKDAIKLQRLDPLTPEQMEFVMNDLITTGTGWFTVRRMTRDEFERLYPGEAERIVGTRGE